MGEMAKFYLTEVMLAIGHLQSLGISAEQLQCSQLLLNDDWHLLLTSVDAVKGIKLYMHSNLK